jgi:peroxiredoxin
MERPGVSRFAAIVLVLALVGCRKPADPYASLIQFNDDAQTNSQVSANDLLKLKFSDPLGKDVSLDQYRGRQNVVVVITRGYVGSADLQGAGSFCVYCSTQTTRLINNYHEFRQRDAEVLLVFPVLREEDAVQLRNFAAKAQGTEATLADVPFPMVVDLELSAVDQLGIRDDLSKPATYIVDKKGAVRFAYVGQTLSDRPSIKAMLAQLDAINNE